VPFFVCECEGVSSLITISLSGHHSSSHLHSHPSLPFLPSFPPPKAATAAAAVATEALLRPGTVAPLPAEEEEEGILLPLLPMAVRLLITARGKVEMRSGGG